MCTSSRRFGGCTSQDGHLPIPDCPRRIPEECSKQYQEGEVAMHALAVALSFAFVHVLTLAIGHRYAIATMGKAGRFINRSRHPRSHVWRCVLAVSVIFLPPILGAEEVGYCGARSGLWCACGQAATANRLRGSQCDELPAGVVARRCRPAAHAWAVAAEVAPRSVRLQRARQGFRRATLRPRCHPPPELVLALPGDLPCPASARDQVPRRNLQVLRLHGVARCGGR